MSEPNELTELLMCLKELSKKMDILKKKDLWDKLPIISSFVGTAVIGALSLVLTQSYQKSESNRQENFQAAQIAAQKSQIRIEELKAITSLAPLLASKDQNTKNVGIQLLRAVSESNRSDFAPASMTLPTESLSRQPQKATDDTPPALKPPKTTQLSLIDKFAQIALASNESTSRRVEATKAIGKIAGEITTPFEVKEQAVNAVTNIAMSPAAPDEVRKAAAEIVASIKSLTSEQFTAAIAKELVVRKINEIIVHHSAEPSIATYKGPDSIIKMAESQMAIRKWSKISWHYAIAPDGMIWLGMPLDKQATHAAKHNDNTVSVLIVINGDKETPTESQSRAIGILLRDLLEKFQLSAEENFSEHKGFHRDYYPRKTCPGNNLTKGLILNCIKEARSSK